MLIEIRYWGINTNKVLTRYFNSAFIGYSTANNLYQNLTKLMNDQILSKIIQLPMDGPSVNWKFYEHLTDELDSADTF